MTKHVEKLQSEKIRINEEKIQEVNVITAKYQNEKQKVKFLEKKIADGIQKKTVLTPVTLSKNGVRQTPVPTPVNISNDGVHQTTVPTQVNLSKDGVRQTTVLTPVNLSNDGVHQTTVPTPVNLSNDRVGQTTVPTPVDEPINLPKNEKVANHLCDICEKAFTTSNILIRHRKSHFGTKKVLCMVEGCDKSFIRQDELKQHNSLKHSTTFRFTCPKCNKGYKVKVSLTRHLNKTACGK